MTGVLTGFLVIGVLIAVGWVLARTRTLPADGHVVLNRFAYAAATPALLFTVVSDSGAASLLSPNFTVAAIAFAGAALLGLLGLLALRERQPGRLVVGMAAAAFANSNNIGLPLTLFVLGDIHYAAIVMVMQSVFVTPLFLISLTVIAGRSARIGRILLDIVRNPILIATAAGLLVAGTGLAVPEAIMAPVRLLADAAIPVVLVAFGASLVSQRPMGRGPDTGRVVMLTVVKLVAMPLVALGAALALGLNEADLFGAVIVAALPTGQMVFSYALRFETASGLARDVVLLATAACVPVIIVIALLFHH